MAKSVSTENRTTEELFFSPPRKWAHATFGSLHMKICFQVGENVYEAVLSGTEGN